VDTPRFVNRIAIVEFVWVLESAYAYDRRAVGVALERLLRANDLVIEDATLAWCALRAYRGGADFADAFVAETNARAGCTTTATFDRAAAKCVAAFELIARTP